MRPDKQKVIDEVWDDDRIKSFLGKSVPRQSGEHFDGDADFHVLLHAYHAMRPDDFTRFLGFFTAEGGNASARNGDGQTLAQYLTRHAKAAPFIAALEAAG